MAARQTRRFAILLLWAVPGVVMAAQDPTQDAPLPEIADLSVGFAGVYKVGVWTPVEVVLRGHGKGEVSGRVSIVVPDGEGVPSRFRTPKDTPCRVAPGAELRVGLVARFGRVRSETVVRFETADGRSVERAFRSAAKPGSGEYPMALDADRRLIVCYAASEVGVEEAAALVHASTARRPAVVRLDTLAQMPIHWCGYEGVDAVIIATSRPEVFQGRITRDGPQVAALDRWIRLGGRLVLAAGEHAREVADPASPLASLVPGRWTSTLPLVQISGLADYLGGSASRVESAGGQKITAARMSLGEGQIEAQELDLPLVVRADRGFGQVRFLAVDLDAPALAHWKDRGLLVARLLGWSKEQEETTAGSTLAAHLGFSDISGQLRSALDRYDGVWRVPFGAIVVVMVVYIALVGPADYWLLRRMGRLSWTWVTFPLLVIAGSAGAYWAVHWLKGTETRLNQLDLVDVDTESGLVRGTHWSSLYSPRADTFNLSLDARLPDGSSVADVNLAWLGLPGSGLGGMNPRTVNPAIWRRDYAFSPALDRIEGLPIPSYSSRSLVGRWSGTWKDCPRWELVRREDVLGGRLTNPLDVRLARCLLVYDRWVYKFDGLAPGESIRVDELRDRTELKALLTGQRRFMDERGDKMELRSKPYAMTSVDLFYILRTMMFFEDAGGESYVRLSNQYQPFVDGSDMLQPDRAILVGVGGANAPPGVQLERDGKSLVGTGNRPLTVYRFILPVKEPGETAALDRPPEIPKSPNP